MRHRFNAVASSFVLVSLLAPWTAFAASIKPSGEHAPGEVIVKFRPGTPASAVAAAHQAAGVDKDEALSQVSTGTIRRLHSRSKNTEALIKALEHNPNVTYVEPNYVVRLDTTPNDPSFAQLWGLLNTGQSTSLSPGTAGAHINAAAAWNVTTGSSSVVVGVVDTGVNYDHPDLAANIWSNPGGAGNVNCAAGTHGFNAITKSCDPMDDYGHGTHVSGTIGAVGNNGTGVTGVNWTTSIMALKFISSSGSGTTADAIAAIDFAVQAKIDGVNVRALNNSWGGGPFSKALFDEILKANEHDILFVASAGNSEYNIDAYPTFPASYGAPNLIAVAATDNRDQLAYFSNYGPSSVHLGAPGVGILSTRYADGYSTSSGTSMAAPHVTGVAALVLAKTPGLTTAQVRNAILDGVDSIPSLAGKTTTGGRLNAAKALGAEPASDFTISLSASSAMVLRGDSASVEITITPSGSFSDEVSVALLGLPYGVSASLSENPTSTTSTLTLETGPNTPLSSTPITINAVSGELAHSLPFTLQTVISPPVPACPVFSRFVTPSVFSGSSAAALGDFNRDGNVDLAVVSPGSNAMSIVLGQSGGTYVYGSTIRGGTGPIAVVAEDFNGDGVLDLATANSGASSVSIRLGLGDGTFVNAVDFPTGANPFWIASGDFDGDGRADLAVANNSAGTISILRGNGDGSFQSPVDYTVGSGPFSITVGDLNRDGKQDLAVAVYNANTVAILLGNGDGSFQPAVVYTTGGGTSSVAIGDLNGDGVADLAVTGFTSNDVSVRLGNGDGTFQPPVSLAVGNGPYSVAIIDIDDDGLPDLAVAGGGSSYVTTLRGHGDGTFDTVMSHPSGSSPGQLIAADMNRDGLSDLVVVNTGSSWVSILRATGACRLNCGSMVAGTDHAAGAHPKAVAIGDFNGDGNADVAIANQAANTVSIALSNGDGSFQPSVEYGTGTAPNAVAIADVNGDGALDLAIANRDSNDVSILLGNSDGSFQASLTFAVGTSPRAVAIDDFDRDGKADLAVANGGSNNVSVLPGNGTGLFGTAVEYAAGANPESIVAADFDRDGRVDLAVANSGSSDVTTFRGNGDGTFQAGTSYATGTTPVALVTADFDRDGRSDLATANAGSDDVSVLRGTGTGSFDPAEPIAAGSTPSGLTAADFDDDGVVDLAVANAASNDVTLMFGQGDGSFSPAGDHATGSTPAGVAAADFDGDGKLDLAVANGGTNDISVLLNLCPAPDLVVTKTHAGSFTQGDTGRVYTITVTNAGGAEATGLVSMTDSIPLGVSATALSGSGWNCALATVTCTRSDALGAGASYPPITLTANISNSAPVIVTNNVTVAGGGELNVLNNSASDPATVSQVPDLTIDKTHSGSFVQGATGRKYTILVRNPGGLPTVGTVTVTDNLPTGLTATAIDGSGWNCSLGALTCSRSDALAPGSSYPAITVTVNVAAAAPAEVINTATVSGGGEIGTTNNTAQDRTIVWSSETCASFTPPTEYAVRSDTVSVAVGDFNGDGIADLASASYWYGGISVLLGTGGGAFAPAVTYLPSNGLQELAVADLNQDGILDLAAVNYSEAAVSILRGLGDGTFEAPQHYRVANSPRDLTLGDFDGDGKVDIAVTFTSLVELAILIGNGDGSLRPPVYYAAGEYVQDMVDGDFDGDGKVDLAVVNGSSDTVSLLRGNGNGSFEPPVSYPVQNSPLSLAAGDFDDDGDLDLAVTHSYSASVSVLLGNGDATFAPAAHFASAYTYEGALAVEDVHGDGRLDIVVGTSSGVTTLAGHGDGTFQPPTTHYLYNRFRALAISDLNADGKADIVGAYYSSLGIMLGDCPDLVIEKSHTGAFLGGQSNARYSLIVSNVGAAQWLGTVTVTDTLPAGLTATLIHGSGWTCTLASVSCTRTDSLAPGAAFSEIVLYVSVSDTAATSVTNVAHVSGSNELNTANNSASDPTTIVQGADLEIVKRHSGAFAQGGSGSIYTITVSNVGSKSTTGAVTVVDSLPLGLTATSLQGTGWSCNLGTLSCTRNDALAKSQAYPPITLTVSVAQNCWQSVTNLATVSGGGDTVNTNNSSFDETVVLGRTSVIGAQTASSTSVNVSWNYVYGAADYLVHRATAGGGFIHLATTSLTNFTDNSLAPNTVYRYRVQARAGQTVGPMSIGDSAITMTFTDDPIVAGSTPVKAVHFVELRTGVNLMRAAAGLAPANFTDPSLAGATVKAIHYWELWERLHEARAALGLVLLSYSDYPMTSGKPIRALQIQQLRNALK